MAQDYNNVIKGYRVQTQIPANTKTYCADENTLKYLGVDNNLAFVYEQGLIVYCVAEETRWEWREVREDETEGRLMELDFTYPDAVVTFGIDYSNRIFNFFPAVNTGANGQDGNDGLAATIALGSVTTGAAGTNVIITNSGTSSAAIFNFTIPKGDKGDPGNDGNDGVDFVNNLQRVVTYPTHFSGINYTITNADNNYLLFINNGSTAVNITVPSGLMSGIEVGFIQRGTGDVTFIQSGTTIDSPLTMKKIKGQHYNAYLVQIASTNVYPLIGNLKA